MKEELQHLLLEKYPILFSHVINKNKMSPIYAYGIECNDGWYNILDVLCNRIQYRINKNPELLNFRFEQIKEKFGELRIYSINGDEVIDAFIAFAEDMSLKTCEICGNPGVVRPGNWILTLCDECQSRKIVK